MSRPNYNRNFDFYASVEIKQTRLKELFKAATRTTAESHLTDEDALGEANAVDRKMALFWQAFVYMQLQEEPDNQLLIDEKSKVDARVTAAFDLDGLPWELIAPDDD